MMKEMLTKCFAVLLAGSMSAALFAEAGGTNSKAAAAPAECPMQFGCCCPGNATGTAPAPGKCHKMKMTEKAACPKNIKHCPLSGQALDPNGFSGQAAKLGATLASAFQQGDSKSFLAALPEEMRKDFNEKHFEKAHKEMTDALGQAVSVEYVTDLEHPLLNIQIWKLGFQKEGENGEVLTQQALFQVSIGKVNDKPQVVSFGFI